MQEDKGSRRPEVKTTAVMKNVPGENVVGS
jgi:hypothetical protein